MSRTRDNYQVRGNTVAELLNDINFKLQRLADRIDKLEGIRGTASIESNLDMNTNVITDLGGGTVDDDAARLSDIQVVSAFTITAGAGLTGGGAIGTNPSLDVGAGTGIAVGADAVSVATDGVTNTLLADMAQASIKGRAAAAGTGDPTDLTAAQVKTILALVAADISDFNEAAEDAVLGSSVDSATIDIAYNDAGNSWTASVIDDSITNAKLANMAQATVKGRASAAGTGDPTDLAASDLETILSCVAGTFTATLTGGTTAPTVTARYVKRGNMVSLYIPSNNATSNTTSATITGVPAAITPTRDQGFAPCLILDNGSNFIGLARARTTSIIELRPGTPFSATGFTGSGSKGHDHINLTYNLD